MRSCLFIELYDRRSRSAIRHSIEQLFKDISVIGMIASCRITARLSSTARIVRYDIVSGYFSRMSWGLDLLFRTYIDSLSLVWDIDVLDIALAREECHVGSMPSLCSQAG
jgi:hypothetical protein